MFILRADKNRLTVREREMTTSGSVGVYTVRFEFSPDWDGMERTAVFMVGSERWDVPLDGSGTCTVPWEALRKPNLALRAGVRGVRDGIEVLPTVWATLGLILEGVLPGGETRPPALDPWKQALALRGDGLARDGMELSLTSGGRALSTVELPSWPVYQFGHGLRQEGTTVAVDAVSDFSGDNTLPMTAAGVQASVGNIEALLATI